MQLYGDICEIAALTLHGVVGVLSGPVEFIVLSLLLLLLMILLLEVLLLLTLLLLLLLALVVLLLLLVLLLILLLMVVSCPGICIRPRRRFIESNSCSMLRDNLEKLSEWEFD